MGENMCSYQPKRNCIQLYTKTMDYEQATTLLELPPNFEQADIKSNYYRLALLHHPDKGGNNTQFKAICEAYQFLSENKSNDVEELPSIVMSFFGASNLITTLIHTLLTKQPDVIRDLLMTFELDTIIKVSRIIEAYHQTFRNDILDILFDVIRIKMATTKRIELHPTLDDMWNRHVYSLNMDGETYYVPLWQREMEFNGGLTVCCVPDLPTHILLDEQHNIHYILVLQMSEIFGKDTQDITFTICTQTFTIPVSELYIRAEQTYVFKYCGILRPDVSICDAKTKANNKKFVGDVIVNIRIC